MKKLSFAGACRRAHHRPVGGIAVVQPAVAAKKEDPKPGLKLSQEFVKVAQPAKDGARRPRPMTRCRAARSLSRRGRLPRTTTRNMSHSRCGFQLTQGLINAKRVANPNAPVDETVLAGAARRADRQPQHARGRVQADLAPCPRHPRRSTASSGAQAVQYLTQARQAGLCRTANIDIRIATSKFNAGDNLPVRLGRPRRGDRQGEGGGQAGAGGLLQIRHFPLAGTRRRTSRRRWQLADQIRSAAYPTPADLARRAGHLWADRRAGGRHSRQDASASTCSG